VLPRVDVAVIGGGYSGLGVALRAVEQGKSVVLFERMKCGAATSAYSHRIVHGGFRYLQQGNLKRVRESAVAQRELLARFPEALRPLPCLMPLKRFGLKSRLPVRMALAMFDLCTKGLPNLAPGEGRILTAREVKDKCPLLAERAPYGALLWWDVQIVHPELLLQSLLDEIRNLGGTIHENANVVRVQERGEGYRVSVQTHEELFTIDALSVVNASGPWVGKRIDGIQVPAYQSVRWCKAFNVTLRRVLESEYAIAFQGAKGNLYFMVPRKDGTAIGTVYIPLKDSIEPEEISLDDDELVMAFSAMSKGFPELGLSFMDIKGYELGVLPVEALYPDGRMKLYGSEKIHVHSNYVEILSTKLTTCLIQGEKVLKQLHLPEV